MICCRKGASHLPVTWSQSAAVPAPAQKMLGASLCSFSQFLSATMEPAVALVSAESTTPPCHTNHGSASSSLESGASASFESELISCYLTYIENATTDGRTGLGELLLRTHLGLGLQSGVAEAVVVVEAAERDAVEVVQFHHYFCLD